MTRLEEWQSRLAGNSFPVRRQNPAYRPCFVFVFFYRKERKEKTSFPYPSPLPLSRKRERESLLRVRIFFVAFVFFVVKRFFSSRFRAFA